MRTDYILRDAILDKKIKISSNIEVIFNNLIDAQGKRIDREHERQKCERMARDASEFDYEDGSRFI